MEVVRAPAYPSKMARQNPGKPKPQAEPPKPKDAPFYQAPQVIPVGALRTSARRVGGVTVWSVGTLNQALGKGTVRTAMAAARGKAPLDSHSGLFPVFRTRSNGRISPVVCVSLEGLRVLARHFPPNGKAGRAVREYLGSTETA